MITDMLWGGTITELSFDLVTQTIGLVVTRTVDGATSTHAVAFTSVVDLRFRNAIEPPWRYAELTEVHPERTSTGDWEVQLILWSEACVMTIRCGQIEVNGVAVQA